MMTAHTKKPILITRAAKDAEKFQSALHAMGFETVTAPLISIEPVPHIIDKTDQYDAVIFTSRNGVYFSDIIGLPAFCVNDSTARTARDKGFDPVFSAHGNVQDLTDLLAQSGYKNFLYVRGEHTSAPLTDMLKKNKINITETIVYRAIAASTIDPVTVKMLQNGEIGALTFFSRRTAYIFVTLAMKYDFLDDISKAVCFGISENVLEPFRPYMQGKTYAADTPDMESFLRMIEKYKDK